MPNSPEIQCSAADLYLAVDLGAGSGRVFLASLEPGNLVFEEISRFHYPPREKAGHLRWDFDYIFSEVICGLKKAGSRAVELGRQVRSVAVDSWGVDYGLIDDEGKLLADPICYRDDRALGTMAEVFAKFPRSAIFAKTGIQFLTFNTIYRLYAESEEIERAGQMLLLPDLINFFLTGKACTEYTNATTTQLVNARLRDWDRELIEQVGFPDRLFSGVIQAGTDLGPLKPDVVHETDLTDVCVVATATHDTASAVAGAPIEPSWAYISSGTWSLIGVERSDVLINQDVARHNFTNEGGVFGTIRFLKNVMGLWIFESCRREWMVRGIDTEYGVMVREAAAIDGFPALIFPDDERFLNPLSMLAAIETQLRETGQQFDDDPVAVSKVIFDSLAFRYASVLKTIESLTGDRLGGVQIVGGGGRNEYLNQMTANASGLEVQAGLVEATAMGNILVQAITAGRFMSLSEGREYIRSNSELKEYFPSDTPMITSAARRYAEIEARFVTEMSVL